jgi:hypothetical protein
VVGRQIAILIPGLFFCHNLCCRCPNGSCEPIFDIYTLIAFQWYKEIFNVRSFDPWNHALKIWEPFRDYNSQHGRSLGSVRVHSLTLFALPKACEMTPGSPSWPTTLQPFCLGREPKARVATLIMITSNSNISNFQKVCISRHTMSYNYILNVC